MKETLTPRLSSSQSTDGNSEAGSEDVLICLLLGCGCTYTHPEESCTRRKKRRTKKGERRGKVVSVKRESETSDGEAVAREEREQKPQMFRSSLSGPEGGREGKPEVEDRKEKKMSSLNV